MKNKRFSLFGLIWVGLAVIAFSVLGLIYRLPDAATQLSLNERPAMVTILHPLEDSRWPADAFVPVGALVISPSEIKTIELWADGRLIGIKTPTWKDGQVQAGAQWQWMPGKSGDHTLLVRAATASGEVVFSNLVRIYADPPAGFNILDFSQPDEQGNPSPIPGTPLQLPEMGAAAVLPPQAASPAPENGPNRFTLWMERNLFAPTKLAAAPDLGASADGCSVKLYVTDHSEDESGFFIYRAEPGSSAFERMAELGSSPGVGFFEYTVPNQKGPLQYYVSAFNGGGEAPSNPIQVEFQDADCLAAEGSTFDGKTLTLAQEVQAAYFYYSVNQQPYNRYPNPPNQFLSPVGSALDLSDFLEGLVVSSPQPVQTLDLEIWGWQNDSLLALGRQHIALNFTDLKICNLGSNCTGDVASTFRSHYGSIASNSPDQVREFTWVSNVPGTTNALWQIASQPLEGSFHPRPPGLLASGCVPGEKGGSFTVDFAHLEQYSPASSTCVNNFTPYFEHLPVGVSSLWNLLRNEEPGTLYARIIPMNGNQPAGRPSNTVVIRYQPGEPTVEPVILDHLPDSYRVEITSFSPIQWGDAKLWGCVYIRNLDYNALWNSLREAFPSAVSDSMITSMAKNYTDQLYPAMVNHWPVCPAPYQEEDKSWLEEGIEAIGGALEEIWNSITELFNELKASIVDVVAEVINALGIECGQTCKSRLMTGLEIGMTYFTGIPPSLPTFDELKNAGIDYMIDLAASEAGIPCPEMCKSAMREALNEVFDTFEKSQSQPGCVSADLAKVNGKSPLCLPPGVETEAVPEGITQPALVTMRVTNVLKDTPLYQYENRPAYVVRLKVKEVNPNLDGETLYYSYRYYKNPKGIQIGNQELIPSSSTTQTGYLSLAVPISGEISGSPFQSESIPLPALAAGQSVTIPVHLRPAYDYLIPQHILALLNELEAHGLTLDDVGGWYGGLPPNDWDCLYKSGRIWITAQLYCLSTPPGLPGQTAPTADSQLVPCSDEVATWFATEPSDVCGP